MRIAQFEALVLVAAKGSIRAAARDLFLTPPAISKQIQTLEAEIGGALFERIPRGVRLTPAGRALLPRARSAIAAARRGESDARAVMRAEMLDIEIAAVNSVASSHLPRMLQGMGERFQAIRLKLHEFDRVEEMLEQFDYGVGDIAFGPVCPREGLVVTELGAEEFIVLGGGRELPQAIPFDHLSTFEWTTFSEGHGLRRLVESICEKYGFRPKVVTTSSQVEAVARLAGSGIGIALVPKHAVPTELMDKQIRLSRPIFRVLYSYTHGIPAGQNEALIESAKGILTPVPTGNVLVV